MATLRNFLTGNTLAGIDAQRIGTDPQEANPPPTLNTSDVAYYRPDQLGISWGLLSLEETGPSLLRELDFLKSIGFAVQRDGRWYVDRMSCGGLYNSANGIFLGEGDSIRIKNIFLTFVLPAYAAMTESVASVLPATIYDGQVARDQHREIQKLIRDLKSRP